MIPARNVGKLDGLVILLIASQVFLALSFVRVMGDAGSAAFGEGVFDELVSQPIWGTKLGAELAKFAATLVFLHAALAVFAWVLARLTLVAWPGARDSQRTLSIFWLLSVVVWLIAANAAWFPVSSLGEPYRELVRAEVAGISVFSALSVVFCGAIVFVLLVASIRRRALFRSKPVLMGGIACLAVGMALPVFRAFGSSTRDIPDDRPHIVVIGIDSLRNDFVQSGRQLTPEIDSFLAGASRFSNAYTPLARTFPAWVSIVSGRHPHTTGAFVNLLPRELIDEGETMPDRLASDGYRTVYAIDEVRFSNLDESYGFDEMLAPPMGAADFMLGFFSDTPLANILVNTRLGMWLFPYGYANRAAAKTYDPDSFITRIGKSVSFDGPTLLAVHFTLVHWPYTWATAPPIADQSLARLTLTERASSTYSTAVRRVDEQFGDLMRLLQDKGALDNAIVIVLSDHGESLGEPSTIAAHDHVIDHLLRTQEVYGHGTNVFSPDQYNVVLALRSYGNDVLPDAGARILETPVSLEDIAPTVLDLLSLDQDQDFDGRSLVPFLLHGENQTAGTRIRFLETEFNPTGISPDVVMTASAISTAADKYEIDPRTDRIRVKMSFIDEMLSTRQYAAEANGRIVASIPAMNYREQHLLYYDPEADGPSWLADRPTASDGFELVALWEALEQRFPKVRERPIVPPPQWDEGP